MRRFVGIALLLLAIAACASVRPRENAAARPTIPLLTFVFDDGYDTDYLIARDIFSEQGVVACSAITTDWIGRPGYMTADQIVGLRDAGWEIMGHTATHPNLRDLSPALVEDELTRSKKALTALDLAVNNLVYPYNKSNPAVRQVASRHYRSARGGGNEYNSGIHDLYELRSFSNKRDLAVMMKHIDHAYREKEWVIIYHHDIDAKITLTEKNGQFFAGEPLYFSPSGSRGRHIRDSWFLFSGSAHIVPLAGTPLAGDLVTGGLSKASARVGRIVYNERALISDILQQVRKNYSEMRIVTIDQGLDILGMPALNK